jgi:hypothetical protein
MMPITFKIEVGALDTLIYPDWAFLRSFLATLLLKSSLKKPTLVLNSIHKILLS